MSPTLQESESTSPRLSRRRALGLGGAAVAGGALATVAGPLDAVSADEIDRTLPVPSPIPGSIPAPPVGDIHWWLPGPVGAMTPVLALEAMGLDVEPSTITDFHGSTAFAILAGTAQASDGNSYPIEVDVRVMSGQYVAGGDTHEAAFAFF